MLRMSLLNLSRLLQLVKPQKSHIKDNKIYEAFSSHMDNRKYHTQRLRIMVDTLQESQEKYREFENIGIDPKYIVEEQEKRQPLSFLE